MRRSPSVSRRRWEAGDTVEAVLAAPPAGRPVVRARCDLVSPASAAYADILRESVDEATAMG